MSAELAARRTAAAAVLADFKRETDKYIDTNGTVPRPDMGMWAWRLSSELRAVLERLEAEDTLAAGRPRTGALAINLDEEVTEDRALEIREALDHAAAAAQLAEVRQVLGAFDWETSDRQYALEKIDDIVHGRSR